MLSNWKFRHRTEAHDLWCGRIFLGSRTLDAASHALQEPHRTCGRHTVRVRIMADFCGLWLGGVRVRLETLVSWKC